MLMRLHVHEGDLIFPDRPGRGSPGRGWAAFPVCSRGDEGLPSDSQWEAGQGTWGPRSWQCQGQGAAEGRSGIGVAQC